MRKREPFKPAPLLAVASPTHLSRGGYAQSARLSGHVLVVRFQHRRPTDDAYGYERLNFPAEKPAADFGCRDTVQRLILLVGSMRLFPESIGRDSAVIEPRSLITQRDDDRLPDPSNGNENHQPIGETEWQMSH